MTKAVFAIRSSDQLERAEKNKLPLEIERNLLVFYLFTTFTSKLLISLLRAVLILILDKSSYLSLGSSSR